MSKNNNTQEFRTIQKIAIFLDEWTAKTDKLDVRIQAQNLQEIYHEFDNTKVSLDKPCAFWSDTELDREDYVVVDKKFSRIQRFNYEIENLKNSYLIYVSLLPHVNIIKMIHLISSIIINYQVDHLQNHAQRIFASLKYICMTWKPSNDPNIVILQAKRLSKLFDNVFQFKAPYSEDELTRNNNFQASRLELFNKNMQELVQKCISMRNNNKDIIDILLIYANECVKFILQV